MTFAADFRVSEIAVTPVKGFAIQHVESARLESTGVVGDREFFLIDDSGELFSATRSGAFVTWWASWDPDSQRLSIGEGSASTFACRVQLGQPVTAGFYGTRGVEGRIVEGDWSEMLSRVAGRSLRLVKANAPCGGVDIQPITLVSAASIAALGAERNGRTLDSRRFRLNLTIDGPDSFEEESWAGCAIDVGMARLLCGEAVPRCAATLHDPEDGTISVNPLRLIAERRGARTGPDGTALYLGVYATLLQPGIVRVGDPIRVHRPR